MSILKKILFALVGIIALGLLVAAFLPKKFKYEKSITINAPKEVVFGIANDLKTQETWGPWGKADTTIKNTYNEVASGVGQVSSWVSENSGNGTQTITESTPPTSVKTHLEFEGQAGADAWFTLTDGEGGGTNTAWGMEFAASWPSNIFMALFGGKMMDKMIADGLDGLKEMAEQQATEAPTEPANGLVVTPMDFPGRTYLGIRQQTTHAEVMKSEFFATRFSKIMNMMQKSKIKETGAPAGVFYTWDEAAKTTDVAVAIPIAKGTAVAGDPSLKVFDLPAGKALVVDHYGAYDGIGKAHEALGKYISKNGLKEVAPVIEEYVTDPEMEKDTAKWLTKVYYFVESGK